MTTCTDMRLDALWEIGEAVAYEREAARVEAEGIALGGEADYDGALRLRRAARYRDEAGAHRRVASRILDALNPSDPEMDDGTLVGALARSSDLPPATSEQVGWYRSARSEQNSLLWNTFIACETHRAALWAWAAQN